MIQRWKQSLTGFIISSIVLFIIPPSVPQSQQIVLRPHAPQASPSDLERSHQVLTDRLAQLGLSDQAQARLKNQAIILTAPNSLDQTNLMAKLTTNHQLSLIETGVEFPTVDGRKPVRIGPVADPDQSIYQQLLHNADFLQAEAVEDNTGLDVVLTPEAATRYAATMANRHGVYICLAQDSVVVGCPIVKLVDGDRLEIRQGPVKFLVETSSLAEGINAGYLPIPLVVAN